MIVRTKKLRALGNLGAYGFDCEPSYVCFAMRSVSSIEIADELRRQKFSPMALPSNESIPLARTIH